MYDRPMIDWKDSCILWVAMRSRASNVSGNGDCVSRRLEMECQHELMQRYPSETIMGGLIAENSYTSAYMAWCDKEQALHGVYKAKESE